MTSAHPDDAPPPYDQDTNVPPPSFTTTTTTNPTTDQKPPLPTTTPLKPPPTSTTSPQRTPEEEAAYLAALRQWAEDKDAMKPGDGTFGAWGTYAQQASLFGLAPGNEEDGDPNNDERRGSFFKRLLGKGTNGRGE